MPSRRTGHARSTIWPHRERVGVHCTWSDRPGRHCRGALGIRGGKIRHSGTDRATREGGWRIRSKFEALDSETRDRILSNAPLGRAAAADEVAATIAFLASENASYISVQGLPVDGAYR